MHHFFGFLCVCAVGLVPLVGCTDNGGAGIPCGDDADCPDDNNACTEDQCDNGDNLRCIYPPVECDADLSDCTVEMCDPAVGCEQTPVADGTQCAGGTCQAGVCELTGSVLPCSEQGIRNAIAAGGDEPYTFDCDGPTTMTGGFVIDNDVILDGEGNLTVEGGRFFVGEEVTAELRRFTVTGGSASLLPSEKIGEFPTIGGILNNGTLTVTDSTVSNTGGTGISNGGTLTMTNSTVSGNRGDLLSGGIENGGTLTMTNSTVSGNTGGGIGNGGTLTMTNSTVSGNMAHDPENEASGIWNGGTLTLMNSLVDGDCSNAGVITSNGNNIESPGNTCGFDQEGDQPGVSAVLLDLQPLADNDGLTQTHAITADSAAFNAIPNAICEVDTDQRGVTRPQGPGCDVGAFELEQ